MKKSTLIVLIALLANIMACSNSNRLSSSPSPQDIAEQFYNAVFSGNVQEVENLMYIPPEWASEKPEIVKQIPEQISMLQSYFDYKGVVFGPALANDEKSIIRFPTTLKTSDGDSKIDDTKLHKTPEGWKVEFR